MKKILIIGAGAMGSAFAVPCIDNKNDVTIVGTHLENDLIEKIKSNDQIHPTLKTKLSGDIKFEKFEKLQTILEHDPDIIVCGVSSIGIEWFVRQISKNYKKGKPIILLTKGLSILDNELTTLSDKIRNILSKDGHSEINISAIKGPCLAAG
jgi:glycerol-3-phosphate dehydrogenase (NAD(P)+)